MSLTIDLIRIMNPIIRIMLLTIMRMLLVLTIITIIVATTTEMRNIIVISLLIEAMNRAMIIRIITEIPATIILAKTHRNQTKSHRNTCTKYMNQHSVTTQHPWTTTRQNHNNNTKAITSQKINGMQILNQMVMYIPMLILMNININSKNTQRIIMIIRTNMRILMLRIVMMINHIWPTISKILLVLLMIISSPIRQAIHIQVKLALLRLMTLPIVPKIREHTNLAWS